MSKTRLISLITMLSIGVVSAAYSADHCTNMGELSDGFCDKNHDLVADLPADEKQYKDPGILYFSYSASKDPSKYEALYEGYLAHLSSCSGKPTKYYPVISKAAEAQAIMNGELHIAGFSTGAVPSAVNKFGVVPFATQGDASGAHGYHILVIVKKDSEYYTFEDLRGKRFAHANPSSNSGHIAPMALFPKVGMVPGRDYEILFSGDHVNSVLGVYSGKYDGATTNTHAFRKPEVANKVRVDDFRVLYESPIFPGTALTFAHDIDPTLVAKIKQCTYEYRFDDSFQQRYSGADRFVPIDYKKDWEVVREIAE